MSDPTLRDAKDRLRAEAKRRRAELPVAERTRWSGLISDRLAELLPRQGRVLTYAAMGDELDLAALNEQLGAAGRLVLPRVEGRRLVAVPVAPGDALVRSRYGVPEPLGSGIEPRELVAVVVPGLAFDARGYRVGYGAGFYDRFLPEVSSECLVVGACFAAQLVDRIPAEPHDIAVASVVTERGRSGEP